MSTAHLFVYGTLRRGTGHRMAEVLAARARLVGAARAPGRLYDLGPYPGMAESDTAGEWVRGEVYELGDPDALLAVLDRYEGYDPRKPGASLFVRRLIEATLDGSERVTAWAYFYAGAVEEGQRIASGDYLAP